MDIQNGRKLVVEHQAGHGQDLESYIRNKLRAGTSKQTDEITREMLQKAARVFMWVVLGSYQKPGLTKLFYPY